MKFNRFFKLKRAIENLDVHFIAKKIAELEESLTKTGQPLDQENTAITQEGIYYIHPPSGMAVKVVLYQCDHSKSLWEPPSSIDRENGYRESNSIERLNPYHLVRCNALSSAEKNGWPQSYYVAQRPEGTFFYRFITKRKDTKGKAITEYQEINNQKLFICDNCYIKCISLLEGVSGIKREEFPLQHFFDVDFFGSWCRYSDEYKESESLANMYPADWRNISTIRMRQVEYMCEACEEDFSDVKLKRFLHVIPVDYVKNRVSYVRLQCVCLGCLADYPERDYLKAHPDFLRFMAFIEEERPKN